MTASAVPTVLRALRDGFAGLFADVTVTLGAEYDETPGTRIWVGLDDPETQANPSSARSRQVPAPMGGTRNRDETGEVACAVLVQVGQLGRMDEALDQAEGVIDAIGGWLISAPFQELPQFQKVVFGSDTQWLMPVFDSGPALLVQFSVTFVARIYP